MRLELVRHAYLEDMTLGWLRAPELSLATIERPWKPNPAALPGGLVGESCVPDGTYEIRPHDSDRFPNTYVLSNSDLGVWRYSRPEGQTWGRTAILIHIGNRVQDVIGCIAVGTTHGELYGSRAVLSSRLAMNELRALLKRESHGLTIRPTRGTNE